MLNYQWVSVWMCKRKTTQSSNWDSQPAELLVGSSVHQRQLRSVLADPQWPWWWWPWALWYMYMYIYIWMGYQHPEALLMEKVWCPCPPHSSSPHFLLDLSHFVQDCLHSAGSRLTSAGTQDAASSRNVLVKCPQITMSEKIQTQTDFFSTVVPSCTVCGSCTGLAAIRHPHSSIDPSLNIPFLSAKRLDATARGVGKSARNKKVKAGNLELLHLMDLLFQVSFCWLQQSWDTCLRKSMKIVIQTPSNSRNTGDVCCSARC